MKENLQIATGFLAALTVFGLMMIFVAYVVHSFDATPESVQQEITEMCDPDKATTLSRSSSYLSYSCTFKR